MADYIIGITSETRLDVGEVFRNNATGVAAMSAELNALPTSVAKLTTGMEFASRMAERFGVSANESSKITKEWAESEGLTVNELAEKYSQIPKAFSTAAAELMQQEAAAAGDTQILAETFAKLGSAEATLFAEMQRTSPAYDLEIQQIKQDAVERLEFRDRLQAEYEARDVVLGQLKLAESAYAAYYLRVDEGNSILMEQLRLEEAAAEHGPAAQTGFAESMAVNEQEERLFVEQLQKEYQARDAINNQLEIGKSAYASLFMRVDEGNSVLMEQLRLQEQAAQGPAAQTGFAAQMIAEEMAERERLNRLVQQGIITSQEALTAEQQMAEANGRVTVTTNEATVATTAAGQATTQALTAWQQYAKDLIEAGDSVQSVIQKTMMIPGATEAAIEAFLNEIGVVTALTETNMKYEQVMRILMQSGMDTARANAQIVEWEQAGIDSTQQVVKAKEYHIRVLRELVNQSTTLSEAKARLIMLMKQEETETKNLIESTEMYGHRLRGANQEQINTFEVMRGGRLIMSAMLAEMMLMRLEMGEQVPVAMQQTVKGMQSIINSAVGVAFLLDAIGVASGGAALGIGGLVGITAVLGSTLFMGTEEIGKMNTELESLAKKDDAAITLAKLADVSYDQAVNAEEAARKNKEYASGLFDLVKKAEPVPPLIAAIGGSFQVVEGQGADAQSAFDNLGKSIESFTKDRIENLVYAWNYAVWTEAAAIDAMKGLISVTDIFTVAENGATQAVQNYRAALSGSASAQATLGDLIRNTPNVTQEIKQEDDARKQLNDTLLAQAQRLAAINLRYQQERDAAALKYSQDQDKIQQTRDNSEFDAFQTLKDREYDVQVDYNDRVDDINFEWQQKQAADDIAAIQRRQQRADRMADIAFQEAARIAEINFQAGQAEESAKTYAQVLQIRERADFDRQATHDKADWDRLQAQRDYQQAQHNERLREALDEKEYEHKLAVAERTLNEELYKANRTYLEALATAERAYNQQTVDAQNSYNAQRLAAEQRYEAEKLAIQQVIDKANADFQYRMSQIAQVGVALDGLIAKYVQLGQAQSNVGLGAGGGALGTGSATGGGSSFNGPPASIGLGQPMFTLNVQGSVFGLDDLTKFVWRVLEQWNRH